MVVGCPKCKARLRVDEAKIAPEGTKFKCPKCAAVLRVTRPAPSAPELDKTKVVAAHEKTEILEGMVEALEAAGYKVHTAMDGVDAMVKAMKDFPFLVVVDAGVPKINGFELARRIKARPEGRDVKVVLVTRTGDPARQRKDPPETFGVAAYIEETEVVSDLAILADALAGKRTPPPPKTAPRPAPAAAAAGDEDPQVVRAKRLARTVLSDIELYAPEKVMEAVRNDNFKSVFADELREGLKHYENRIPAEVRNQGNFFEDTVEAYLQSKRQALGL